MWSDGDDIQHPIIREALRLTGITGPYLEIVSLSDIPAGTGLGSSGKFHHRAAARAAYHEPELCASSGIGRTGVSHRN